MPNLIQIPNKIPTNHAKLNAQKHAVDLKYSLSGFVGFSTVAGKSKCMDRFIESLKTNIDLKFSFANKIHLFVCEE